MDNPSKIPTSEWILRIIAVLFTAVLYYILTGCTSMMPQPAEDSLPPPPPVVQEEVVIEPQIMHGFQEDQKARKEAFDKLKRTYPRPRLHVSGYTIYDEKGRPIDITVETYYFNIDENYFSVVRIVNGKILYMDTVKKHEAEK